MLPTLTENTVLAADLGKILQSYAMRLVTAESCTGGGLAETITHIPGSSAWFDRGFISYSNAAKQDMLHVLPDTLDTAGAVSREVAMEMAKGALSHSLADIAIAITGIAGPEGGSLEKPVGTVWIAWAVKGAGAAAQLFQCTGEREAIRQQAIYYALHTLLSILHMHSPLLQPPVITLDGPSGTGKGTLCYLLAKKLGWHYLDSGASFRVLAHAALQKKIDLEDALALEALIQTLQFEFVEKNASDHIQVLLDKIDITAEIRTETCGNVASKIAVFPAVRQALLERQRAFRKWPGLVTDGRDMGTVIFPEAILKFFLYADRAERANRRFHQLKKTGVHATLTAILQDLEERDTRDQKRGTAPLKPSENAILIDTTHLSIEAAFAELMRHVTSVV